VTHTAGARCHPVCPLLDHPGVGALPPEVRVPRPRGTPQAPRRGHRGGLRRGDQAHRPPADGGVLREVRHRRGQGVPTPGTGGSGSTPTSSARTAAGPTRRTATSAPTAAASRPRSSRSAPRAGSGATAACARSSPSARLPRRTASAPDGSCVVGTRQGPHQARAP